MNTKNYFTLIVLSLLSMSNSALATECDVRTESMRAQWFAGPRHRDVSMIEKFWVGGRRDDGQELMTLLADRKFKIKYKNIESKYPNSRVQEITVENAKKSIRELKAELQSLGCTTFVVWGNQRIIQLTGMKEIFQTE
jgi:hypothetical protein